MAFKMKKFSGFGNNASPMDKVLVGNQKNLPEHLKKKIEAAPESPTKLRDGGFDDRLTSTMLGTTDKEQRKIESQYRRGKRQGHSKKTVNERMNKGMDYLRKVKLPSKKVTKLDTSKQELMDTRTKKQKRKDRNKEGKVIKQERKIQKAMEKIKNV